MGSALSTAQPFKFNHRAYAPPWAFTLDLAHALSSPRGIGILSLHTTSAGVCREFKNRLPRSRGEILTFPDTPTTGYSGVISMVFQHSGSVHAYPGSSFPFQFVSGRMCVCVCVCTGLAPMDSLTSISRALEICSPHNTKGNRPIKQYKGAEKGPRKWV